MIEIKLSPIYFIIKRCKNKEYDSMNVKTKPICKIYDLAEILYQQANKIIYLDDRLINLYALFCY